MTIKAAISSILMTVFATVAIYARDLRVEHLLDSHTLVRLVPTEKFILLPVQEDVRESDVHVPADLEVVAEFNVRKVVPGEEADAGYRGEGIPAHGVSIGSEVCRTERKVHLAAGQEAQFRRPDNRKDRTYELPSGQSYGAHGGTWEYLDLFQIDGRWISLVDINPDGPFGGSATQDLAGRYDGKTFSCNDAPAVIRWSWALPPMPRARSAPQP